MKSKNNLLLNLFLLILLTFFGELLARFLVDYKSDYYAVPKTVVGGKSNIHPFGSIPKNSHNHFDKEWDNPKLKKRYGYIGDSVIYGVGAGFPYRITEYLDIFDPTKEHVNLSAALENFLSEEKSQKSLIDLIKNTKVDKIVYILNLTDLVEFAYLLNNENTELNNNEVSIIPKNYVAEVKKFIFPLDIKLRGNSVLYTFFRYKTKNFLVTQFGLNFTGFRAIELEPVKFSDDIEQAAMNFAKLINKKNNFIDICILMLPYEMQVSTKAKNKYRDIGVKFEDEFINFYTQKLFISKFKESSKNDIYYLGNSFPESEVGEYFVYNLGDKIDFNHPNREGHKLIAKEISERKLCFWYENFLK